MPFRFPRLAFALVSVLALAACQTAAPPPASKPAASAAASAGPHVLVAAANPLAVDAGVKVLRAGGSAADAAVAIQAVLALVEPQSSSLAGGAFMAFYDAKTRTVTSYDGREVAPASAGPDWFFGDDGKPLPFVNGLLSGRSTGVPGAIAMLALAQKEHGKLAWKDLFADGEALGDNGFTVSPRLAGMIVGRAPQTSQPDVVRYFTKPDGTKYVAGDVLKNPAYAASLRKIAAEGPAGLLTGQLAQDIVAKVHEGAHPSTMTMADLAAYQPRKAAALCHPWKVYVVCTPQLPSGGIGLLEALLILDNTDIAARGPSDPVAWLQMAEAERLMYADRNRYVGDPAFVKTPVAGLLDAGYVKSRAALISDRASPTPPAYGNPPGVTVAYGPDHTLEPGGTTHYVIVDADGNVVSMTTTVESIFGSGRMVDGFFLNNQLTDFSFQPKDPDGAPAANAVQAGKRPRSAMSPVIVLDKDGKFVAAMGSPGGPAIISYVLKTMIGVFDWGLSMQQAIDLPNMVARDGNFSSEVAKYPPGVVAQLQARGVAVREGQNEESGLHGVIVRPGGVLEGGADKRREGVVRGF